MGLLSFTSRSSPHPSHLPVFPGFQLWRHVILRPILLLLAHSLLGISLCQLERGTPFGRGLAARCIFRNVLSLCAEPSNYRALLLCAGLALALLLLFFSPENLPGGLSLSDVEQSIRRRDGTSFYKNTGALSPYVNTAQAA
jgi:hypothetical protein